MAKQEPAVGALFEAVVREGRTSDIAAPPLETVAIVRGHTDIGMEAHASAHRHVG